jgi:hypothetical protein
VLKNLLKFQKAPHIVRQLYGVPHGILRVFNPILYKSDYQNPQIFQQTIKLLYRYITVFVTRAGIGILGHETKYK